MRRRASSLRSTDVVVRTRPGREVILFGKTSNGSCWVDSQRNELRRGGTQPNNRSHGQLFRSFFAGGFECSTHLLHPGLRLDLVRSTDHDKFAYQDYLRLTQQSMRVAREGVRWHLVEKSCYQYDFSTLLPIVLAARATGMQVVWDLCHFGWPDHLDLFSPQFVTSLARYGVAVARWLAEQMGEAPFFVPVNEISFFSWASGDEGSMFPFASGRGFELKKHLVRATLETMNAIWAVLPGARFVHVDPIIHVVASPKHSDEIPQAEAYGLSQFQAWDMLCGRLCPELGGHQRFLDIVGVNFYPQNQWVYDIKDFRRVRKFTPLSRKHPQYRPFRHLLQDVYARYHRPLWVAETGAEDRRRASWLRYVCEESIQAMRDGVPLEGICLYPILNHPGWVDDRHCHNGLWDYPDESGNREAYKQLAHELDRWRGVFDREPAFKQSPVRNGALTENSIS